MAHDYDWLVIGSGFGGSVSALRLREKGYSVGVLECGRRFGDDDFPRSTWDVRRYFWAPRLGMRGIFRLSTFKDVGDRQRLRGRRRLARLREHALPRAPQVLRGPAVGRPRRLGDRARAALRRGRADARRGRLRRGRPRRRPAARVRARDRRRGHVRQDARRRAARRRAGGADPGPVLRRRRPRPHGLPALRALHDRLPARRQEHAGEELPVARRARRRARCTRSGW